MTVTLADVCAITMGQAPRGESYNNRREGLPLIAGAGDFDGARITPMKFTTQPTKFASTGDIVLSIRASIGAKVWADETYCLGRGVAGLRPGPSLDPRYLWHWLSDSAHMLAAKGRGATFSQVSKKDIEELPIDPPPLSEQRRIAAILDKADALRAKRRQVLAHLETLTQSIFHSSFGDRAASSRLGAVVTDFRYGTSNKSGDSGEPTLRIPNVVGGSIDPSDLKLVPVAPPEFERLRLLKGDLLFVRSNGNPENVGRCAAFDPGLVDGTGWPADRFIYASYLIRARLDLKQVRPVFIATYLASVEGRRALRSNAKTSAGQYNINIEGLSAVPIPLPPLDLQLAFVRRVEAATRWRTTVLTTEAKDNELFTSLQARAFRGKL